MILASSLSWSLRACAAGPEVQPPLGHNLLGGLRMRHPVAIFTVGRSLSFPSAYLRMCKPPLAFLSQVALTKAEPPAPYLCACVL